MLGLIFIIPLLPPPPLPPPPPPQQQQIVVVVVVVVVVVDTADVVEGVVVKDIETLEKVLAYEVPIRFPI